MTDAAALRKPDADEPPAIAALPIFRRDANGAAIRRDSRMQAIEEARQCGREEGRRDAVADFDAQLNAALERIAERVVDLHRELDDRLIRLQDESLALIAAIVEKIAPDLIARLPRERIERFVRDVLPDVTPSARLTLRAAPDVVAAIGDSLQTLIASRGIVGRFDIVADPDIDPPHSRLEWDHVAIHHDGGEMPSRIVEAIHRFRALAAGAARRNATTP